MTATVQQAVRDEAKKHAEAGHLQQARELLASYGDELAVLTSIRWFMEAGRRRDAAILARRASA